MAESKRRAKWVAWISCGFSLLAACGGDDARAPAADSGAPDSGAEADAGPTGDPFPSDPDRCLKGGCPPANLPEQPEYPVLGDAGDGWLRLIEADWELAPGSEGYRCVRLTLASDVFVHAFSPLSPYGTHHTVLLVDNPSNIPDGVTVCGVGASGERRLQGSGAGSGSTATLPPGVAMKIGKGQQLLMNLHLFNPTDKTLRGRSGMRVKTLAPNEVKQEAEVVLAGPLNLNIPRGRVVQRGTCTLSSPSTVFSVGPHMHQTGAHAKIIAHSSISGDRVLHDGDYDFNHQLVYQIEPIQLAAGDKVEIECTYLNDTDRTLTWGDSSLDEMCFAGLGMYPATGTRSGPCTN